MEYDLILRQSLAWIRRVTADGYRLEFGEQGSINAEVWSSSPNTPASAQIAIWTRVIGT